MPFGVHFDVVVDVGSRRPMLELRLIPQMTLHIIPSPDGIPLHPGEGLRAQAQGHGRQGGAQQLIGISFSPFHLQEPLR